MEGKKRRVRPDKWIQWERWVPIQGYEGVYSISNMGRVRRERSWWPDKKAAKGKRLYNRRIHKPHMRNGELRVDLKKDGETTHHPLIKLMATHFHRPWADGESKVKLRNPRDLENYSVYNIRRCKGGFKLSDEKREAILKLKGTIGHTAVARQFKVSRMTVWRIWKSGETLLPKQEHTLSEIKTPLPDTEDTRLN